jgi:hypothetical protein
MVCFFNFLYYYYYLFNCAGVDGTKPGIEPLVGLSVSKTSTAHTDVLQQTM